MDELRVREAERVVRLVVEALAARPQQERRSVLDHFPLGACDAASYALGIVLEDPSVGRWHRVTRTHPDRWSDAHTWLELRSSEDCTELVVDATVHQFQALSTGPYVGPAPSPAERRFSRLTKDYPFPDLPEFEIGATEAEALRVAREALGDRPH